MKRPGRPRGSTKIDEPRSSVSAWLPVSAHDRLIKLAAKEQQSLSRTIRRLLTRRLR
jgi:hypothetical protein